LAVGGSAADAGGGTGSASPSGSGEGMTDSVAPEKAPAQHGTLTEMATSVREGTGLGQCCGAGLCPDSMNSRLIIYGNIPHARCQQPTNQPQAMAPAAARVPLTTDRR